MCVIHCHFQWVTYSFVRPAYTKNTSVELSSVESRNCFLGALLIPKLTESKPFRAISVAIIDNSKAYYSGEQALDSLLNRQKPTIFILIPTGLIMFFLKKPRSVAKITHTKI